MSVISVGWCNLIVVFPSSFPLSLKQQTQKSVFCLVSSVLNVTATAILHFSHFGSFWLGVVHQRVTNFLDHSQRTYLRRLFFNSAIFEICWFASQLLRNRCLKGHFVCVPTIAFKTTPRRASSSGGKMQLVQLAKVHRIKRHDDQGASLSWK